MNNPRYSLSPPNDPSERICIGTESKLNGVWVLCMPMKRRKKKRESRQLLIPSIPKCIIIIKTNEKSTQLKRASHETVSMRRWHKKISKRRVKKFEIIKNEQTWQESDTKVNWFNCGVPLCLDINCCLIMRATRVIYLGLRSFFMYLWDCSNPISGCTYAYGNVIKDQW